MSISPCSVTDSYIWVHGWGASEQLWHQAAQALPNAAHHYVDFLDCISSDEMMAAIIERMAAAAAISQRCHLVGWSMGGMLVIESAAAWLREAGSDERSGEALKLRQPNKGLLASLVLVGSTLRFVASTSTEGWPPRVLQRMRQRLAAAPEQTLRDFAVRLLAPAERQQHEQLESELIKRFQLPGFTPAGLDAGLAYLASADLADAWAQLCAAQLPVLWLHGEEDPLVPIGAQAEARRLAGPNVRSVEYRRLTGQGHVPFLTHPREWDEEVSNWHEQFQQLI